MQSGRTDNQICCQQSTQRLLYSPQSKTVSYELRTEELISIKLSKPKARNQLLGSHVPQRSFFPLWTAQPIQKKQSIFWLKRRYVHCGSIFLLLKVRELAPPSGVAVQQGWCNMFICYPYLMSFTFFVLLIASTDSSRHPSLYLCKLNRGSDSLMTFRS